VTGLPAGSSGLTLDAGALIAIDRGDELIRALIDRVKQRGGSVAIPAGALGQVWRDGAKQARLAQAVKAKNVVIVPLDQHSAKAVGVLCGWTGTSDIVDVSVVLCARLFSHAIVTSDPNDIQQIDPKVTCVVV
jgi:hypothetical protein